MTREIPPGGFSYRTDIVNRRIVVKAQRRDLSTGQYEPEVILGDGHNDFADFRALLGGDFLQNEFRRNMDDASLRKALQQFIQDNQITGIQGRINTGREWLKIFQTADTHRFEPINQTNINAGQDGIIYGGEQIGFWPEPL